MADYIPALKKLLRQGESYFERQGRGDHQIWYSPITNLRFSVDDKIKSRHTANGVLKQVELPKHF